MAKDPEQVMHFPIVGLHTQMGFDRQPIQKTRDGTYAQTCPVGVNVKGYDAGQDRSRGGSRPGTVKYLADRPGGVQWVTQCMDVIVYLSPSAVG